VEDKPNQLNVHMVDELDNIYFIFLDRTIVLMQAKNGYLPCAFYGKHILNASFAFWFTPEFNCNEHIVYFDPNSATCKVWRWLGIEQSNERSGWGFTTDWARYKPLGEEGWNFITGKILLWSSSIASMSANPDPFTACLSFILLKMVESS
jgi:hypothetical protein